MDHIWKDFIQGSYYIHVILVRTDMWRFCASISGIPLFDSPLSVSYIQPTRNGILETILNLREFYLFERLYTLTLISGWDKFDDKLPNRYFYPDPRVRPIWANLIWPFIYSDHSCLYVLSILFGAGSRRRPTRHPCRNLLRGFESKLAAFLRQSGSNSIFTVGGRVFSDRPSIVHVQGACLFIYSF